MARALWAVVLCLAVLSFARWSKSESSWDFAIGLWTIAALAVLMIGILVLDLIGDYLHSKGKK